MTGPDPVMKFIRTEHMRALENWSPRALLRYLLIFPVVITLWFVAAPGLLYWVGLVVVLLAYYLWACREWVRLEARGVVLGPNPLGREGMYRYPYDYVIRFVLASKRRRWMHHGIVGVIAVTCVAFRQSPIPLAVMVVALYLENRWGCRELSRLDAERVALGPPLPPPPGSPRGFASP